MPKTKNKTLDLRGARESISSRRVKTVNIAAESGVTTQTVMNWENGTNMPRLRLDQFLALARSLELSPEDLWTVIKDTYNGDPEFDYVF